MSSRELGLDQAKDYAMQPSSELETSRTSSPSSILASNTQGTPLLQPEEDDPLESPGLDCDAIHAAIQEAFELLTDRVVREAPSVQWKVGRSQGKAFPLFSYRIFYHLDGDDYDPIVVGVTLIKDKLQIQIRGDISGDETGHIYFDQDCNHDSEIQNEMVSGEAAKIANRLASQDQIVSQAIRERHIAAMPR